MLFSWETTRALCWLQVRQGSSILPLSLNVVQSNYFHYRKLTCESGDCSVREIVLKTIENIKFLWFMELKYLIIFMLILDIPTISQFLGTFFPETTRPRYVKLCTLLALFIGFQIIIISLWVNFFHINQYIYSHKWY